MKIFFCEFSDATIFSFTPLKGNVFHHREMFSITGKYFPSQGNVFATGKSIYT